ncbi:1,4-dihydroxy-2-naphthoate polyprenyltransferase [Bombilactobacillus bombi]|uniref:1,4-dihydroxy-2-naphthoate polyprenyltransferase n=1 Tax=Bombilactobacillus bombi TaxID=1303590 RepID=UPI0015E62701|nr:1,4-dihydroxy-2-naphthoate polyprenyltransferase [Bombilactobacillus bombi]MBA1433777.1 1,4-dihydroxy-2-naphthoate polyprenyltransferase [Bombilactobacillus bombi]
MKLSVFLELVEIKAKTASIFPFLLGTFYAAYHFQHLNWLNLILFFIAMLLFNMSVDVNDNYWDYQNATGQEEFKKQTNVIGVHHLNIKKIGWLDFIMAAVAALIGLFLVARVGWILLALGLFCFAVGFFYAGGPCPINSLPLGEFFSGFTMGFIIFLIAVYINVAQTVTFNWQFIAPILLASGLSQCAIASLLLANNICDYQEDIDLGRHTIVRFLGVKNSLGFYALLLVLGYLLLIVAIVKNILPWTMLLTLLVIPIVYRNTTKFFAVHIKKQTFPLAVKNLFIITATQVISFAIGLIF